MEVVIIIICIIIILILIFANKSQSDDMQQMTCEIRNLIHEISLNEITPKDIKFYTPSIINELRAEILKLTKNLQNNCGALEQKYFKLMRAYMLFRKKSEIDIIKEIEDSIEEDYESLGSSNLMITKYISSAMADFYTLSIKKSEQALQWKKELSRSARITDVRNDAKSIIERAKICQYTFEFALVNLLREYPEISSSKVDKICSQNMSDIKYYCIKKNNEIKYYEDKISHLKKEHDTLKEQIKEYENFQDKRWLVLKNSVEEYKREFGSNLTAIPYMSRLIADIMTIDLDRVAWALSWGNNQERQKKVASISLLKKEKSEEIAKIKGAEYQLAYLLELYPALQDVIDTEFKDLDISYNDITEHDPVIKYLEKDEWQKLTDSKRNQLALDRYIESRKKSKWQIGRDYELYCGYCYEKKGYRVDYYGSYHGLEDLGRDLIIKSGNEVRIVQCKYWSQNKQIHENHIMQLYGSVIEYNLENNTHATGILLTNTTLSAKAKDFAKILGIDFKENHSIGEFPRIKCNIGVEGKIYHLPFDQQYDSTIIEGKNEFMAFTVEEAEKAGFRRAYKWHGNN